MNLRRFTSVTAHLRLIPVLAILIFAPASAMAAPGGGAQVGGSGPVNTQGCTTGDGITLCFDGAGEDRYIVTPAGVTNYEINFRYQCVSVHDDEAGTMLFEQCWYNMHQREQWQPGAELQLQSIHQTGWNSQNGETCDITTILHQANGQLQYDYSTTDCTPTP